MKRLKIICFLFLYFFSPPIYSQNEEVLIRGRFYYNETPYLQQLDGRLGNSSFRSDSNGEFKVFQSSDKSGVEMTINNDWKVLFPFNGFFPFTLDSNYVWKVFIGKVNEESESKQLFKKIEELKESVVDPTELKKELDIFKREYSRAIDDKIIKGIEQQVIMLESIRLENERRDSLLNAKRDANVRVGKKKTLDLFSSDIRHFISRALDVEDAFRLRGNRIFNDRENRAQVAKIILAYSEAYEQLNKNRTMVLNGVEEYWQDEFRTSEAQDLLDYALNDLHKLTMLTANELIRDIECASTMKQKKCPRKKKALKSDAERFNRELHYKIDILKSKKDQTLQKLKYKE